MKSFTDDFPIYVVCATQRNVKSPKVHDFGSIIYDKHLDRYFTEKSYENIDVVDRIGSGDAYISGVLYGLLSTELDCGRALEFGNAAAAVKNTIPGDMPTSDLNELEHIIRDHKSSGKQSEMER